MREPLGSGGGLVPAHSASAFRRRDVARFLAFGLVAYRWRAIPHRTTTSATYVRLTSRTRALSLQQPEDANVTGVINDGFVAFENEPGKTASTWSGGAGASSRSPVIVGARQGGVVTQSSLSPIEPSGSTRSWDTAKMPSDATPAQRSPLPYQDTLGGCPGGLFPFGSVTGHDWVVPMLRTACER